MKIEYLSIENYKSIKYSGSLNFHEKFNILAGRNNTGKTALLEAISKGINCKPIESSSIRKGQHTEVYLLLSVNKEDMRSIRIDHFPIPDLIMSRLAVWIDFNHSYVQIRRISSLNSEGEELGVILEEADGILNFTNIPLIPISPKEYQEEFLDWLRENVIFISALRHTAPSLSTLPNESLDSYASNLHTVLYTIRNNNGTLFEKIEKTFLEIFPEIKRIHTHVNHNEVLKETLTNLTLEFKDNSEKVPLQECGSGYTQTLVLLCLIHSEKEKIILFDEPHTFLHPYAEKAIYDLTSGSDRHQYIFSTHSPLLINYPVDKTTYFVKRENGQSKYLQIDTIQELLEDIGVQNSNFAFSDRVIFVEGATEERILPIIFKENGLRRIGFNYTIINLNGTGRDFKNHGAMVNNSNKLEGIFNSISTSPIPYKIMLDRDERDEVQVDVLKQNYKGKIIVLPRREIENYFLVPEAIVQLVKDYTSDNDATVERVESSIKHYLSNTESKELYPKGCKNPIEDIKGSKVLELILNEYSINYNKVKHGLYITEWLYANNNRELDVIYNLYKDFIEN